MASTTRRADFRIGKRLGAGAFGVVMACKFRNTDCAIKQLHKESSRAVEMLDGLLDEFDELWSLRRLRIQHPLV